MNRRIDASSEFLSAECYLVQLEKTSSYAVDNVNRLASLFTIYLDSRGADDALQTSHPTTAHYNASNIGGLETSHRCSFELFLYLLWRNGVKVTSCQAAGKGTRKPAVLLARLHTKKVIYTGPQMILPKLSCGDDSPRLVSAGRRNDGQCGENAGFENTCDGSLCHG